ncbi:hypothetical protein PITC_088480 [Penicillium italicum]|uniref:DUF7136 domain-containing protein n=1 Tax=Penicillium italicum TaxID=40296 RepID=A0A0A2L9B8_PENIT|nr:hypothetical protein PITC_088480 [Penicillium italicum]
MKYLHFIAWSALMTSSILVMGNTAATNNDIFEVDLISPRNQTYTPQALMPVVFALQNWKLSETTASFLSWDMWEGNNWTSLGSQDGASYLDQDPMPTQSSGTHFITRFFNTIDYPDGTWTFQWSLQLWNCSDNYELQGDRSIQTNNTVTFTVSRQLGKAPDLVAATSAEECGSTIAHAYNVTRGGQGCGYISPSVTANPCSVAINSSAASSIMASATALACDPLAKGIYPNVTCPASPAKSNHAGPSREVAAVLIWLTVSALVTILIHLG